MATAAQVTQAYQDLLGRAPDAGGLANYQRYGSDTAIRSSIMGSSEYKNRQAAPAAAPANVSQPLFDFAAQQKAQQQALLDRQNQQQQGLFDKYSTTLNNQEQLPVMYQRLQQEQGIPDLTKQANTFKDEIYRTKNLLDGLNDNITARTQGTYTNQAMRDRMQALEGGQLSTQLSRLGTGLQPVADMLTSAQGQVATLLPLYQQQQQKELQPVEMQINSLGDRFAREISGFNTDRENQLTAVLDKLERERTLSDREWQQAADLAKQKAAYSQMGSYLQNLGGSGGVQAPAAASSPVRQLPALPATTSLPNVLQGNGGSPLDLRMAQSLLGQINGIPQVSTLQGPNNTSSARLPALLGTR